MPMCEFDTRSGHLRLSATLLQPDTRVDTLQHCLSRLVMDSPSLGVVKLLCSFSGSIMPRPQDGRLRYVGGETRIVSLPRDVSYKELMARMRELYEETFLLKYQQPDEDLDALVSVVNDDDVMNMMEEYDKLGSGDGFTRLRIFLFPHPEQEAPPHFVDASERDSERRYVDALNSLNDAPDPRDPQQTDPFAINSADELHMAEQFYSQMNLEGTIHNQMNFEMPISQYDLHHLTIPHMRSGQHQQSVTQRYAEMEAPWSPAYLSPRHHGHHDVRKLTEFQSSPSARIHMPSGDLVDKLPEEYIRHQVNQQSQYDPHPQFSENLVWLPTGAVSGDRPGFPGNLLNGSNVFEGSSTCEHCQMHFQRNQAFPDSHWKHGEQAQMEQSNITNEVLQMGHPCGVCHRELFLLNTDKKLHHGIYSKEQSGPRLLYNEPHGHERGQLVHHHLNPRAEEARANLCGAGRLPDQYIVNGPGINFPLGDVNLLNGHHVSSTCVQTEDLRYIQPESELGKEVFCDQPVASGPHGPVPLEECGVRHGTVPYACVGEKIYQASHGHMPPHAPWINSQDTMQGVPPYEALNPAQRTNGSVNPGYFMGAVEGNPRFVTGSENKNTWVDSSPKMFGIDGSAISQYHTNALTLNSSTLGQGNQHQIGKDQLLLQTDMMNFVTPTVPIQYSNPFSTLSDDKLVTKTISGYNLDSNDEDAVAVQREVTTVTGEEILDGMPLLNISPPKRDRENDKIPEEAPFESVNFNCLRCPEECGDITKPVANDLSAPVQDLRLLANHVNLPEFLDSIKRTTLECNEEVKSSVIEHADAVPLQVPATKESALDELETANATENSELESENDNANPRRIEQTKAEEEAISRGLQTIRNDDLEEIRELGSGTYGAVFYGKWKGSDVAIKRIKASCFAGKPSERDRLIADFWKEALILSSLHHPNVVSFYGIVRDGPDGSLATVTEFMVNGSLKQFLKKKDRTIDRRKRLIIGMDAAFGMEYLHGKNVVHFDLKCENLLVNMRDPHRPVCKIGDLGLSKVKQQTLVSGGVRGTLPWMAPELLSGKSNMVTEKIDVYSFGIVMWELLTGEEPYGDMHCASIIGGIVNNTLRPQIPTWCDPEWKSLMENCWASDPADRPSFSEVSQKLRSMAAAINVK